MPEASVDVDVAEEFEMTQPPPRASTAAGHRRNSSHSKRKVTIIPSGGSSSVLFGASPTTPQMGRRASDPAAQEPISALPSTPGRLHSHSFLLHDDAHGPAETVEVPDFSGMLGLSGEPADSLEISRGIKSEWKRWLFLLLEEPSSSSEAFLVHVASTCAILAR